MLKNLDLSHNRITNVADCEGLKESSSLTSIDLSHNLIEYSEDILPFFFTLQNILVLYMKANPCVRKIKNYRREFISGLKNLVYFDDRPVFEVDRLSFDAWRQGGVEGEKEARKEYMQEQDRKRRAITARNREIEDEGKKKREMRFKMVREELLTEKRELEKKKEQLRIMI